MLITDLDEHLANRSLVFLRRELKERERRLGEIKSTRIISAAEYQIDRPPGMAPMPLLVIVVDEFARLKPSCRISSAVLSTWHEWGVVWACT